MRTVSRLASVLLLTVMIAACKGKAPEPPKARPPAPVVTAVAESKSVPVLLEAIGNVEALQQVAVKSMVSAEVVKVHFSEGQDVKKGDILFTLDSRQTVAAIRKGEADLARIRAQLATAKVNADRYGRLVKDGIVTAEQYDSYRTQAESLEADLASQQAAIDNLKVQLSYCTIKSPISGRTGNLLITAGNLVKANDSLNLVTINQISPIAVSFNIPESDLAKVRSKGGLGMPVAAFPSGDLTKPETGKISFIDNAVDLATGSIRLKGTFQNQSRRLWPGQFANVKMTLTTLANAVTLPVQALQTGQQGQFVYVVKEDGTADIRTVKSGVTYGNTVVIEQGVSSGEKVVIDGQLRLFPGAKVEERMPGQAGARQGGAVQKQSSSTTRANPQTSAK